jgi:hypothetical protein
MPSGAAAAAPNALAAMPAATAKSRIAVGSAGRRRRVPGNRPCWFESPEICDKLPLRRRPGRARRARRWPAFYGLWQQTTLRRHRKRSTGAAGRL